MTEHSRATDEAQIRTVIDAWADAIRKKDAGGVVSHHGPDFVHFSLAPPLQIDARGYEGLGSVVRHLARPDRLRVP